MTHSRDFKDAQSFSMSHSNFGPASFIWNGMTGKDMKLQLTNYSQAVKCMDLGMSRSLAPRRIYNSPERVHPD